MGPEQSDVAVVGRAQMVRSVRALPVVCAQRATVYSELPEVDLAWSLLRPKEERDAPLE